MNSIILYNLYILLKLKNSTKFLNPVIISFNMTESKQSDAEAERDVKSKRRVNFWMISTIVLFALVLTLLIVNFKVTGFVTAGIGKDAAGKKVVDFFKAYQGLDTKIESVSEESGLYAVTISANSQKGIFYITKDGSMMGSMTKLADIEKDLGNTQQQSNELKKSDKPVLDLFVMSYCPYGIQSEKALIPVMKALKGMADINVRFVHYIMHGEKENEENYRQLCIREEQNDRFILYLEQFVVNGDYKSALLKSEIDQTKVDDCMKNRAEDYYAEDSQLSKQYDVQGSPTFVINGVQTEVERTPAGILNSVCSAFNSEPSDCSKQLSADAPVAGFGTTSDSQAQQEHPSGSCGQ